MSAKLLLVEDNADDEALALRALHKHLPPDSIVVVRDGVAALDYLLDDTRPLPRIVLLDLKLPRLDGLEVLRHLRADPRTQYMPVVVMTSSDEGRDIRQSYALGANSYVQKPVNYERFMQAVAHISQYWLELNRITHVTP
ncbi:MAG: response regulator [Anaerolineales bacterium]